MDYKTNFSTNTIHDWFGLSHANYLVLARSIMQEMPIEWQEEMVSLLDQLNEAFRLPDDNYDVRLRDSRGRYLADPLADYRHINQTYIDGLRPKAPA